MSNIKTYNAEYHCHELFTVTIDHDKAREAVTDMVNFWTGGDERIEKHDGDVFKAWVEQVALYVVRNDSKPDGEGYVEKFEDHGIVFNRFGGFMPDDDDIEITVGDPH